MKQVIETSQAISYAVKLCKPSVIPMYPITPQTHIVEALAEMINNGQLDAEMVHTESEHSALSAALGSEATGTRTFTATASQGLAFMWEVLYIMSGMRMPVVMAVANRALSAPINIWNDHSDTMGARDSGWIQLYAESGQEALDATILAYKIGEKVLLPVMVCVDGFNLSHVYEPVDIPEQKNVDKFLPAYKPKYKLDPKKPLTMGPISFPDTYMYFKKQQQDAMEESIPIIKKAYKDFGESFGRTYGDGLIETYKIKDAQYALLTMGSVSGTARVVVDELRKKGKKVGLIKLICFRPFPNNDLRNIAKKLKGIAVIDKCISLGNKGPLFTEVRNSLFGTNIKISGYIAGLGGKDITKDHLIQALQDMGKNKDSEWLF
jgi:pyruvate ferredoxin oxidoreductase alpha subunit